MKIDVYEYENPGHLAYKRGKNVYIFAETYMHIWRQA